MPSSAKNVIFHFFFFPNGEGDVERKGIQECQGRRLAGASGTIGKAQLMELEETLQEL